MVVSVRQQVEGVEWSIHANADLRPDMASW